jgi:hypothetical protein
MKRSRLVLTILLVSLVPLAITLPHAAPVEAWGLTTHMYIVSEAMDALSNASWAAAFDYYAPELLAGSTTPDQAWQDWDNHLYYPETGEHNAPWAAQMWYDYARDNFSADQWEEGFFALGVMSHYFADPNIPVHTDDNWPGHGGYEADINENLGSLNHTTPSEVLIANVTDFVIQSAVFSHQYYDTIFAAYEDENSRAMNNPTIKSITETCLSRAINGTLCLYYSIIQGINAPDTTYTFDYIALVDYAHTNDYIDYSGDSALLAINQTLARNHFEMRQQTTAFTAGALTDVDLLIVTCGLDAYTTDELTAITNWASSGNKSIMLTARGDFSEYVDNARPNQILQAIGSDIRVNDDNVYMEGTYNPWYNDLYDIPYPNETLGLTLGVGSLTLFSPTSLYFLDEGPTLPIVWADPSGYQTDQIAPAPVVVYDDTIDGVNGEQIPLIAIEEIGQLRVFVAGTTFFSDFDYGKSAIFSNVQLVENFIDWAIGNRSEDNIADVDEMGPIIADLEWTPASPDQGQTVTVTATITDTAGVSAVWVEYDAGDGTATLTMLATGDVYSVELAGVVNGSLTFSVYANDTEGNVAVRGVYDVQWTSSSTTTTDTETGGGETGFPLDMATLIIIGIGVVAVVIIVVIIKRR